MIRTALVSAVRTPLAAARGELRWKGRRRHERVTGPDGSTYVVFRDTARVPRSPSASGDPPAVVVAGFRFRWLGRPGSWRHRLFLPVCIVTVPLFSGLAGYRRKLWLAEVGGDRYLGIYEWADEASGASYVRALVPILRLLGVPGSVHGAVVAGRAVEPYIDTIACPGPSAGGARDAA